MGNESGAEDATEPSSDCVLYGIGCSGPQALQISITLSFFFNSFCDFAGLERCQSEMTTVYIIYISPLPFFSHFEETLFFGVRISRIDFIS